MIAVIIVYLILIIAYQVWCWSKLNTYRVTLRTKLINYVDTMRDMNYMFENQLNSKIRNYNNLMDEFGVPEISIILNQIIDHLVIPKRDRMAGSEEWHNGRRVVLKLLPYMGKYNSLLNFIDKLEFERDNRFSRGFVDKTVLNNAVRNIIYDTYIPCQNIEKDIQRVR